MTYEELGKNIKTIRESKGLLAIELAKKINAIPSVFNKVERGYRVRVSLYLRAAIALNVKITTLFDMKDLSCFCWKENNVDILLSNFRKNMRAKRIDLKYSARGASISCGVHKDSFWQIENGIKKNGDIFKYKNIADFLGVTLEDLFLEI